MLLPDLCSKFPCTCEESWRALGLSVLEKGSLRGELNSFLRRGSREGCAGLCPPIIDDKMQGDGTKLC